jgi:hypothetical protein
MTKDQWKHIRDRIEKAHKLLATGDTGLTSNGAWAVGEIAEAVFEFTNAVTPPATDKNDPQGEFRALVVRFVDLFELVFENDWEHTKVTLHVPDDLPGFITPDGSFLNPGVEDESNNWANRGSLLAAYRRLRSALPELDTEQHGR